MYFYQCVSLDTQVVQRECVTTAEWEDGCEKSVYRGHTNYQCFCHSDKCNGAVMTSSFGHVITAVALLVNVAIGYQLL